MATYLYRFTTGSQEYTVNSGVLDFYFDSHVYPALVIHHSEVVLRSILHDTLTITLQKDYALSAALLNSFTREQVTVEVFEVTQYTEEGIEIAGVKYAWPTEWRTLWKGKISSWGFRGTTSLVLTCKSWLQMLRQAGHRRTTSRSCNHSLYSANCGLNTAYGSAYTPLSVEVSSDPTLKIPQISVRAISGYPFSASNSKVYTGGFLLHASGRGYIRECQYVAGNVVTCILDQWWPGLTLLDPVTLWAGCDKSAGTCLSRFNNLVNFGGQPDLPQDNPITTS